MVKSPTLRQHNTATLINPFYPFLPVDVRRGFSVFSPLLGPVLLAIAISAAVSFMQGAHSLTGQLFSQQVSMYTSPLPQFFKWDMITYFDETLHTWFYSDSGPTFQMDCSSASTQCSGSGSGPLQISKADLADAFVNYLFANPSNEDIKYLWRRIGAIEYLFYVVTGANYKQWADRCVDIKYEEDAINFTFHGADRSGCGEIQPKVIGRVKVKGQGTQWEEPLLGDTAVRITVEYPWGKACQSAKGVCTDAGSARLYYGALGDVCGNDVVACALKNQTVVYKRDAAKGIYLYACSEPLGADWADPSHWSFWRNELIGSYMKGEGWTVRQHVSSTTATEQTGVQYIRLICFGGAAGKLIGALIDDSPGPWCVEVQSRDRRLYDNGPGNGKIQLEYVNSAEVVASKKIGAATVQVDFKNLVFKNPTNAGGGSVSTREEQTGSTTKKSNTSCQNALSKIPGAGAFLECPIPLACTYMCPHLAQCGSCTTSETKQLEIIGAHMPAGRLIHTCGCKQQTIYNRCTCQPNGVETYTVKLAPSDVQMALSYACKQFRARSDEEQACTKLASKITTSEWINLSKVSGKGVASVTVFVIDGPNKGCIRSYCGSVGGIKNSLSYLNKCS